MTHTEEELQGLAEYWKDILRLGDWKVCIRKVRLYDNDGSAGTTEMDMNRRVADVKITEGTDINEPDWPLESDEEVTLVHELLHMRLEALDVPQEKHNDEEFFINCLAAALVGLDRGHQEVKSDS